MIKTYIPRQCYLERVVPFIGKDIIKVIIGQRRVGKSYFMFQVMDYVLKTLKVNRDSIIYINKELHEFDNIKTSLDLIKHIESVKRKGKNYLFIDEIQEIADFHKALESLTFTAREATQIYSQARFRQN